MHHFPSHHPKDQSHLTTPEYQIAGESLLIAAITSPPQIFDCHPKTVHKRIGYRLLGIDTPVGEQRVDGKLGMEGDEHQRRQYEQSGYRSYRQDPRNSDRYRQPATSAPLAGNSGNAPDLASYGYTQGQQYAAQQMQGSSLQYQSEFPPEQRPQQFPQYPSNMIYNVPQQAQQQQQSPYDPAPQYQPRQSAAVEVLSNQFGVPQFYTPGEPTNVSGPAAIPQPYAPTRFQQPGPYQQSAPIPSSYTSAMVGFPQPNAPAVFEQEEPPPEPPNFDHAYNRYQNALRQTFERACTGAIIEAGDSLLEISRWLLGHATELGLVSDDKAVYEHRLKMWDEFNTCWLAVLQRQKDNTQAMLDTGRPPRPPQSILPVTALKSMGDELVGLCDGIERHGLVDYQIGVWEEEIISILTQCIDLQEGDTEDVPADAEASPPRGPLNR